MADVRKRTTKAPASDPVQTKIVAEDERDKSLGSSFKFTDILRILGGLALLNTTLSYFITGDSVFWGQRPWFTQPDQLQSYFKGPVRLTDDELRLYDGSDPTKPIYLALNGTIYDVSAGKNYYGPGGMYGFFSGRDASRAFITGCFDSDLVPDMRGVEEMFIPLEDAEADAKLTKGELKTRRERDVRLAKKEVDKGIESWATLFAGGTGKPYFKVGEMKREEGWLEKMPKRELCENGQKKRKPRKVVQSV